MGELGGQVKPTQVRVEPSQGVRTHQAESRITPSRLLLELAHAAQMRRTLASQKAGRVGARPQGGHVVRTISSTLVPSAGVSSVNQSRRWRRPLVGKRVHGPLRRPILAGFHHLHQPVPLQATERGIHLTEGQWLAVWQSGVVLVLDLVAVPGLLIQQCQQHLRRRPDTLIHCVYVLSE